MAFKIPLFNNEYMVLIPAQKYMLFHILVRKNIGISFKRFKLQLLVTDYTYCTKQWEIIMKITPTSHNVNTRFVYINLLRREWSHENDFILM